MSQLTGFPVRIALCLVLLCACSLQCLAFQNTEERHTRKLQQAAVVGSHFEGGASSMGLLDPGSHAGLPVQTASLAASESLHGATSAEPSGTSLSTAAMAKATLQTILGIHGLGGRQSLDVYTTAVPGVDDSEKQLVSSGPNKELDENAPHKSLLARVVTAPNVLGSTASEGDSGRPPLGSTGILSGGGFTPSIPEKEIGADHSCTPQLTTEALSPLLPTAALRGHSTSPLPPDSQLMDAGQGSNGGGLSTAAGPGAVVNPTLFPTDAILNLETANSQGHLTVPPTRAVAVAAVSLQSDDWDDTKLEPANRASAMQPVLVNRQQVVTEPYLAAAAAAAAAGGGGEEEDDVKKALPPRLSASPATGSQNIQLGSDKASVQGEELLTVSASQEPVRATDPAVQAQGPGGSTVQEADVIVTSRSRLFPETATTTDVTKSDAFQTPRGATQKEATTIHEMGAVLPAATPGYFTTQDARGEGAVMEEERELTTQRPTVSSASQLLWESEGTAVATGLPATHSPVVKTPQTAGTVASAVSQEDVASIADAPVTLAGLRMQTEEVLGTTVALTAPPSSTSSARRPTAPAAHRITTAATYGLDRLESEEEEEEEEEEEGEEEEEEDPDEDDDDDEEDDDDQDTDSMDESLDGDIDLSSFTVPGETSQEPLEDLENPAGELSGVSYQVPSAMEWEQQNQGLVRSWMEKLKDKAGYLSGMLVPVGVGIAGALFILGALYSIKIMNRRRRNGFKRHKRKQREFNSMQDRVMLLADSSEDEF